MTMLRSLIMLMMLGSLPAGPAFAETCSCDSPCSGSVSCSGGCYAYCEENPENSGRHVCVKGCSSEDGSSAAENDFIAGIVKKAEPLNRQAE